MPIKQIKMRHRPLILLLIPLILGILIADKVTLTFSASVIFFLVSLLLFSALILGRKFPQFVFIILLFLTFLTGWIRIQFQLQSFDRQSVHAFLREPIQARLFGKLVSDPERRQNAVRTIVAVDSLKIKEKVFLVNGNLLLSWKNKNFGCQRGDVIFVRGTITNADGERNPGEFNYRNYLKRKNIAGLFYVGKNDTIRISAKSGQLGSKKLLFDLPRKYIAKIFARYVKNLENAALLKGLILGLRGEINQEIRTDFADTGVIHVLAVSGLHVGFVIFFLFAFGKLLRLPLQYKTFFVMIGLLYYMGLTGFKPPVVRAVIMANLYFFGTILQKKVDIYNILAAAAMVILIINPQNLFDVGFQLSFTAVFSIVFFYSKLHPIIIPKVLLKGRGLSRIFRRPLELVLLSFCAQIGTLPLIIVYFEKIPLLATLANLPVVILVQIIVFLGFILVFAAILWSGFAGILGQIISMLLTVLTTTIHWFSSFQFAKIEVPFIPVFTLFLILGSLIFVIFFVSRRLYVHLTIILLIVANLLCWRPLFEKKELRITYLDVGQGDATLVELPDHRAFLIDTGPVNQNYDAGAQTIIPYLKRRNIKKLESIFISHYHDDHSGGLWSIIRQFPVEHIYAVNIETEDSSDNFIPLCDSLGIPVNFLSAGNIIDSFSPLKINILSPFLFMLNEDKKFIGNDCSMVMCLEYGKHRFMFCGDIEKKTQSYLTTYGSILNSDVLKIPHHGSNSSNFLPFLKNVNPEWAVVSVGKWNIFNHPSPRVLTRFDDENIQYVRTDRNGAVIFATDGKTLRRLR